MNFLLIYTKVVQIQKISHCTKNIALGKIDKSASFPLTTNKSNSTALGIDKMSNKMIEQLCSVAKRYMLLILMFLMYLISGIQYCPSESNWKRSHIRRIL